MVWGKMEQNIPQSTHWNQRERRLVLDTFIPPDGRPRPQRLMSQRHLCLACAATPSWSCALLARNTGSLLYTEEVFRDVASDLSLPSVTDRFTARAGFSIYLAASMDASQCGNDRPRFGVHSVSQKLSEYNIIKFWNIVNFKYITLYNYSIALEFSNHNIYNII